ncbi:MAG: VWA domain-containing protein [candidate division WOR-3 bacterium]|nr:VWA domain-containing protein [candidate division WOR-3 bacterium]
MRFGAPNFLWLLPLALIPIIIHLIHRIRLRQINYSSLYFLTSVERKKFNIIQLKEILLLIIRTLFVSFLILSLAQPYLLKALGIKKDSASRVIIFDDSYSMSYKSVFNRAIKELQTIVQETSRGSELAIITSSLQINSGFLSDPQKIKLIVDSIKPTYSHNSLAEAFYKSLVTLKDAIYPKKEIYIITDLQQRALSDLVKLLPTKNGAHYLSKEFPFFNNLEITFIDLGEKNFHNVGIEEVYLQPSLPSFNIPTQPMVKIKNYSDGSTERIVNFTMKYRDFTTRFNVTGESLIYEDQERINLGSFETKTLSFNPVLLDKPGVYLLQINLNPDSLTADDHYFYLWPVKPRPQVLLVSNSEQDFYYVKLALSGSFEITSINPQELAKQNLSKFSVIALSSPQDLSLEELLRIKNYLLSGGALFINCFGESSIEWWTVLSLDFKGKGKLYSTSGKEFVFINQIDSLNPITQILKSTTLRDAQFYSYWALESVPAQNVVSYFSSGDPFLITSNNGKVVISTALFIPEYTNFVFKAPFPVLMHRMFSVLAQERLAYNYKIGDTIIVSCPALSPVKITTPKQEYFEIPTKAAPVSDARYTIKFTKTQVPGVYQLGDQLFTVNVLPEEGDLNRFLLSEFKKYNVKLTPTITNQETNLSFPALLLAIGFLILELILLVR